MNDLNELLHLIQPYYCSDKMRIGSAYDGGYVLPRSAAEDADLLLSFGIATNIDFEKHLAQMNKDIRVMMFDPFTGPAEDFGRLLKKPFSNSPKIEERIPTPEINAEYVEPSVSMPVRIVHRIYFWTNFYRLLLKKRFSFQKKGLRSYNDGVFLNFETLFSLPVVSDKNSIIIKMDIECDEYAVWKQLVPYLTCVSVVVIEIHQVGRFYQDVIEMIKQFKSCGLYIVHVHGNNVNHLIEDSLIPNCLEITFCKEKYCSPLTPDRRSYPDKELDAPCNPRWVDYDMPGVVLPS